MDLRGRYFSAKFTPADLERAISFFEQAIVQDPELVEAHAWMAAACVARAIPLGADLGVPRQRALLSRGKTASIQALAIDGTLAEAHMALGMILLFHDWNWPAAEEAMEKL